MFRPHSDTAFWGVLLIDTNNIRCKVRAFHNSNIPTKYWASCLVLVVGGKSSLFFFTLECQGWLLPRLFLRVSPVWGSLGPLLDLSIAYDGHVVTIAFKPVLSSSLVSDIITISV